MRSSNDIVVDRNGATINGQRITRPSRIAPSEWMEFWEKVYLFARGDKP